MIPLPSGWDTGTIGEICGVVSGGTPSTRDPANWDGDVAWVTPDDLARSQHRTISKGRRSLSRIGLESSSAQILPEESVIFSSRAPIGYVAITTEQLAVNQGCKAALPSAALDSRFLHWQLVHLTPEIESRASGSTFREISATGFARTEILVPPLAEQRRLVAALDAYSTNFDRALRFIAEAIDRSNALQARALEEQIRTGPLDDALPIGWHWSSVGSFSYHSSYGTSTKCAHEPNGPPVLRIPNIQCGRIDQSALKYAVDATRDLERYFVRAGDLLCVRTNGSPSLIGRTAVVDESEQVAFASYLIRFRFANLVTAKWVQLVLASPRWRRYIVAGAATSAGQYNLNKTFLAAIRIPLPPENEQEVIVNESAVLIDKLAALHRSFSALRTRSNLLMKRILNRAFRGELVDQDPTDEPADVLLARIRAEHEAAAPKKSQSRTRKAVAS